MTDFSSSDRKKIIQCFLRWERKGSLIGKTVPKNILSDPFLPESSMKEILEVILKSHHSSIEVLENNFETKCRKMKLQGGRVRLNPLPKVLGRAVNREKFEDFLFIKYKKLHFDDEYDVKFFVSNLLSSKSMTTETQQMYMSEYNVWVTWDKDGKNSPFGFMISRRADEVISSIGLDLRLKGLPLLLLVYDRIPGKLAIHRATIADAELYSQFDPPTQHTTDHGWTRPWPKEALEKASPTVYTSWKPVSCPEAVHKAHLFHSLHLPIQELPG